MQRGAAGHSESMLTWHISNSNTARLGRGPKHVRDAASSARVLYCLPTFEMRNSLRKGNVNALSRTVGCGCFKQYVDIRSLSIKTSSGSQHIFGNCFSGTYIEGRQICNVSMYCRFYAAAMAVSITYICLIGGHTDGTLNYQQSESSMPCSNPLCRLAYLSFGWPPPASA